MKTRTAHRLERRALLGGRRCTSNTAAAVTLLGMWVALCCWSCSFDETAGTRFGCDDGGCEETGATDASRPGDADEAQSSCDYRKTSTGVCSSGTRRGDTCMPPDSWVQKEGEDGGCGDDLDNDCDGTTDEDCECKPSEEASCYTGPSGTAGIGPCRAGTKTCQPDGRWSTCRGEVTPSKDQCGNGRDEDCNGTDDDGAGCECTYDGESQGVCGRSEYKSNKDCKKPSAFEPSETRCSDGKDNDCDGKTDAFDEACGKPAGSSCTSNVECDSDICTEFEGLDRCSHRIFVTSKRYRGDLGGLTGADQKCANVAKRAGLEGTWEALISASGSSNWAKRRIALDGELHNLNGKLIAANESDMWDGSIANPVRTDEQGNAAPGVVWTGSDPDGSWDGSGNEFGSPEDCSGWMSRNANGEAGDSTSRDSWLQGGGTGSFGVHDCGSRAALYCVDGQ